MQRTLLLLIMITLFSGKLFAYDSTQTYTTTTATDITNETDSTSNITSANTNTNTNTNTDTITSTSTITGTNTNTNTNTNSNTNTNTTTHTGTNTNTNVNTNTNANTNTTNYSGTSSTSSTSESTNNSDSKITYEGMPVNSAIAPSVIINQNDLCVRGISAAGQTHLLGISVGANIKDENCERIKLARELRVSGMKVASVAMLCEDARVFKAMMMSGTPCPFKGKIGQKAKKLWNKYPELRPDFDNYQDDLDTLIDAGKLNSDGTVIASTKIKGSKPRLRHGRIGAGT